MMKLNRRAMIALAAAATAAMTPALAQEATTTEAAAPVVGAHNGAWTVAHRPGRGRRPGPVVRRRLPLGP